jgi:DNA polymerase I-like protein with 3'-5' exonuclease and polymerase domains
MKDCRTPPEVLEVLLDDLAEALSDARLAVFDFETSDVRPRLAVPVGLGVYLPEQERCFYVNVGHRIPDRDIPRYDAAELAGVVRPFLAGPGRHAVAHNAAFEIRMFFRLGVDDIRCRFSCSLIHTHRADENLRSFGPEPTYHYHLPKLGYGLKELTTALFGRRPPTLQDVIGGRNPLSAPPRDVAGYCALDVVNAYNLFARARRLLDRDPPVRRVVERIDDPNNVVLARMLWEGIQIDAEEARRQRALYEQAIQRCREAIWSALGVRWSLDKPADVLRVVRHLRLSREDWPGEDWDESVAHEAMVEVFNACQDPVHQRIVALLISKAQMRQRCNAFLYPMPEEVRYTHGRLHADRFDSTLATTRFSSSPNLQNLPGRADAADPDDTWRPLLPPGCGEQQATRNLFVARPGCALVSLDLSAAEPRYLAMLFQRALEQKHGPYLLKREELYQERLNRHTTLLARMRATRKPYVETPVPLNWPDLEEDPLWRVFARGEPFSDPYDALLAAMDSEGYAEAVRQGEVKQWLKANRWRGKKAFLALAYGSQARTLAPGLKWSVERTEKAIENLEAAYPTLKPLRELTLLEVIHLGEVRTLWGRPRRMNGYYQLARSDPLTVSFYRMRPYPRTYVAQVVPLGTARQAVQAFVQECYVELDEGRRGEVVLAGNADGTLRHISDGDPFANADHFNKPPYRNINYSQINWVREANGLTRTLAEQARSARQAFNARCQATGADHLRWLMNRVDQEVCWLEGFRDCRLVLTMHDSLVYEVPRPKVEGFTRLARPILAGRPPWATIDMKVKIEVGPRFGEMDDHEAQ